MNQTLYIFVTSERPDPYINPIVHCVLYKNIRKNVFLHKKGLDSEVSDRSGHNEQISLAVFHRVYSLLYDDLSKGSYRFFDDKKAVKIVNFQDIYPQEKLAHIKTTYNLCLDKEGIKWDYKDINYSELRGELAQIQKNEPESIFDVTAVTKVYIGDIIACCLIEGIRSLYTFALKISPNFDKPWMMLFHELQADTMKKSLYRSIYQYRRYTHLQRLL